MSAFPHVLVIGAGAFGASAALELAHLGHRVTVVDRSADGFAAENAASNDLNKIIRADYSDPHYRDLCKKAMHLWRTKPLYSKYFHETGIFFRSGTPAPHSAAWVAQGVENASAAAGGRTMDPALPRAFPLQSADDAVRAFPPALRPLLGDACASFGTQTGYFNPQGGWAEAKAATHAVLEEAQRLGAQIVPDVAIVSLMYAHDGSPKPRVCGAIARDGRRFPADAVVLAVGSWTAGLLAQLQLSPMRDIVRPSAHCVLTLRLAPEVAKLFHGAPVTFNMRSSGFYSFEPNADGILKCAIHGRGFATPSPRDYAGTDFPCQPDHGHVAKMLAEIHALFPFLHLEGPAKNASVHFVRICWYSDSVDENFVIDVHPAADGLLVASGDSGHAFKVRAAGACSRAQFLPVLGRLVASRLLHIRNDSEIAPEYGLSSHQEYVFSFAHHEAINDPQYQRTHTIDALRIAEGGADAQEAHMFDALKPKL
ncbi:hypothetical protein MSPP1_001889 [Malassezia sp. CBS 17886]|nr:hypothetical protein MSPP1_001889 [Malassezia sp. CBS 17886]